MIEKIREIDRGAEGIIWLGKYNGQKVVIKERISKKYRHPIIDKEFRKYRTRREAKIMEKLYKNGIPVPKVIYVDEESGILIIEYIEGERLSNILEKLNYVDIAKRIGEIIGKIHSLDIIHGDLTTSNFIYSKNKEVFIIDFGLSFHSKRIEDKAVDLHLFRQAIESKHWKIWKDVWNTFLEGYKKNVKNFNQIYNRFLEVEKRGRYKH